MLAELAQIQEKLEIRDIDVVPYELPLSYSYFPADYILRVGSSDKCLPSTLYCIMAHHHCVI